MDKVKILLGLIRYVPSKAWIVFGVISGISYIAVNSHYYFKLKQQKNQVFDERLKRSKISVDIIKEYEGTLKEKKERRKYEKKSNEKKSYEKENNKKKEIKEKLRVPKKVFDSIRDTFSY